MSNIDILADPEVNASLSSGIMSSPSLRNTSYDDKEVDIEQV